jgi:arylsulfatase A-like enzyme
MITRRHFGQGAVGAVLASSIAPRLSAATKNRRPNVLLVMGDEWRAQALGYAGDPNAHTPHIDRFAAQSLNFTQAVAGCPVCGPARASMLSGQYPLTNGCYINDVPLRPKAATLGEIYAKAGYRTGYIGKWHLYGSPEGRHARRQDWIPPEHHLGFEYWKAAEVSHDYNRSFYYEGSDRTKKFWDGYDAFAQTEDACEFIRGSSAASDPFLLVLSWGAPHFPLDSAPERYRAMYRDRDIVLRPNVPAANRSDAVADLRGYYAHIAALDDCFARLLETLEVTGQAEDTVVVFTSDHGDMMESQGLKYKLYPWDESVRVPLLVRYPAALGRQGRKSVAPVNSPDLLPTMLGFSGLDTPAGIEGTDFSSHSGTEGWPDTAFLNLPVPITSALTYGIAEYRGVRSAQYTYVQTIEGPWLLYDNVRDPYQMNNLLADARRGTLVPHLKAELDNWLERLGDEFLPATQYLVRDRLAHFLETQFPIRGSESPWGDWRATLPMRPQRLSIDSALGDLKADPAARTIVAELWPAALDLDRWWLDSQSLRLMQQFGTLPIPERTLLGIQERLLIL